VFPFEFYAAIEYNHTHTHTHTCMSSDFMDAQTGVELTHLFSHPFADNLIMNAASLVFLKIRKEFKVISFTLLISICKIFP